MCERVLASGAAMVIEALSLCFHLACFQVRGRDWVAVAAVDHCLSRLRKGCLRRKASLTTPYMWLVMLLAVINLAYMMQHTF